MLLFSLERNTITVCMHYPLSTQNDMSAAHRGLCWGFRDTLLLGYRAGYGGEETVTIPENIRPCVDSVVKMALLLTHLANT